MLDPQTLKSAMQAGPECLPVEKLEALLSRGAASDPHVAHCLHCQAELALLKSFESSTPLPDEGAAVAWISSHLERNLEQIKHPSRAKRAGADHQTWLARLMSIGSMRMLVPAVAVVAIAAVAFVLMRPADEPQLNAGVGTDHPIYRSTEVQLVSPSGDLSQAPTVLEWKAVQGAAKYQISLMEVDHSSLWNAETKDVTIALPAEQRAKMLVRKPLLWQVTARDLQDRVLATSQIERFEILPKSGPSD